MDSYYKLGNDAQSLLVSLVQNRHENERKKTKKSTVRIQIMLPI